ncbi:MAG TPA: disulfide bond formation protein B [Arenimonas sp.]|uniref:disulfide bond formation protein B n=1 Tax=Arenimonas sp. TaxID=1872635 RepID=UPI002BB08A17|nr:disulfide bond formation protein B [Arenimonas sp.]HMB56942.1 disulfide bond formation protein B [Arenimonas sp.]
MNPFSWSFRAQYMLGSALCFSLLGYALYVQYGMLMFPCPLCILQRMAFITMGIFFLLGAIHHPREFGRKIYALLVLIAAGAGAGVASWHLYLQSLPADQVPLCTGMGLDYMIEAFPLQEVAKKVFTASGECAKVDWTFLGLSMPGWTLICFIVLATAALWAGFRKRGFLGR